jgi:hypothetical protein
MSEKPGIATPENLSSNLPFAIRSSGRDDEFTLHRICFEMNAMPESETLYGENYGCTSSAKDRIVQQARFCIPQLACVLALLQIGDGSTPPGTNQSVEEFLANFCSLWPSAINPATILPTGPLNTSISRCTRMRKDSSAVRAVRIPRLGAIRSQSMANTKVAFVGHHLYRVGLPTLARLATSCMVKSQTDLPSAVFHKIVNHVIMFDIRCIDIDRNDIDETNSIRP